MKQMIACALLCALCLSLAACGAPKETSDSEDSSSSGTGRAYRTAVVLAQEDAYAAQLLAGAEAAVSASGTDITLDVSYSGGSKVTERGVLDALNSEETQGVLCFPVSTDESVAMLNRVSERGVAVSIAGVSNESTSFAASAVSCDALTLGKAAGDAARSYIEEKFTGKAKIAVVHHNTENLIESTLRQNGFFDALQDMKEVTVVGALDLSSGGGSVQDRITAFLKDHTDIDVIFCTTGQELAAVHEAVIASKYTAVLFGVDAYRDIIDIMRSPDNTIQAVAAQDYYAMGSTAMEALIGAMETPGQATAPEAISPILLRPGDEETLASFEERLD